MEGGQDGGSEASYESVPSEGGASSPEDRFEPASERGRDPLPRIISASHCVQVFRRLRWANGAFCCPLEDDDGSQAASATGQELRPHDPVAGLPSRIMRFDGAMEAWLEEMPLPRDPQRVVRPYTCINDAASRPGRQDMSILRAGNHRATLWYFTIEFLQQLWPFFLLPDGAGLDIWERALLDRGCTIQSTHNELGQVHCTAKAGKQRTAWLKDLFSAMQASKWTPDGEARAMLMKRRMSHASMSIGDAVQIGGELFVAGLTGFVAIKQAQDLLPPNFEPENEELDVEEELDNSDDNGVSVTSAEDTKTNNNINNGSNNASANTNTTKATVSNENKTSNKTNNSSNTNNSNNINNSNNTNNSTNSTTNSSNNNNNKNNKNNNSNSNNTNSNNNNNNSSSGNNSNNNNNNNNNNSNAGGRAGRKQDKGKGKGKGKHYTAVEVDPVEKDGGSGKKGGKGKGRGKARGKANNDVEPKAAAEGGRWVPKGTVASDRADRRALRVKLQAERERMTART